MKILIDTNIFHNSYYIKSADLRLMLSYINNEGHELLISDIVLKEVEQHFRDGYNSAKKSLSSALQEYNRFFPLGDETKIEHIEGFTDNDERNPIKYSFLSQIFKYIDESKVVIINSDKVSHQSICKKAFNIEKPFKENGAGYKDSLIWLSFLNYLSEIKTKNEKVAFVSNNTKDFSNQEKTPKNEHAVGVFHDDLIADIHSHCITAEIEYFHSISNLIRHYGINKENYLTSFVDIKSYIENGLFEMELASFLEDSFFKNPNNINAIDGVGLVDLFFKAKDVYINQLSKVNLNIIQSELSDSGILCRCILNYSKVAVELLFSKSDISSRSLLVGAHQLDAITDYDDDFSLKIDISMRIETTFIYMPKEKKEYIEDYGSIADLSIQYIHFSLDLDKRSLGEML
ncbi:TPA: DUF4935 domain-containing protein [Salmonella enterica subsp. salamae serovar 35:g,m,s,t:-]|nr:DUF4935 domain-containing protein [Salmonella enterica subsp. salamae serovar 35:g,m,s,t:-]HCA3418869.1 DUF4935 domain-containing protein [Salmonella enterica subsp. salamae serovar 35:g,m,s,t:-]HCA3428036.1 DUF4935 domain-containing protein [Salmonella enterica subsp. salamae serovar 35:g,m,s,t:-]HCA3437673.1 DUF4935 domain-containing protein [Salmonella enterica subsp. salamae serovar 35:g,m,s,t:-]HCA3442179.1 DUF4935 domain-containing protein [Salmonella enterica subsp. salamae serovar 35